MLAVYFWRRLRAAEHGVDELHPVPFSSMFMAPGVGHEGFHCETGSCLSQRKEASRRHLKGEVLLRSGSTKQSAPSPPSYEGSIHEMQ